MNLLTTVENQPFAHTDPVRLRQAAGNPVSNAVRYTPRGGLVTLRARTEQRAAGERGSGRGAARASEEARKGGEGFRADPDGTRTGKRTERGDTIIVIEASGTGSGIAAEDLTRVFDGFRRAGESRGRQTGGSGPGLPSVRGPAGAHGGRVTERSAPGDGSVLAPTLPGRGRGEHRFQARSGGAS